MKAAGLDGVVWWRRTQTSLLAQLAVQNSSFAEQRRPSSWKMVPVPKLKPVIDINKYLRPISPTSVISKLAQDFVALHFNPTVLEVIDPNQYQRPLPYTPLRTCYMYLVASHRRAWGCCESRPVWLQEGLRSQLPHPTCAQSFRPIFSCAVALWVADFLTHRQQRVNLSRDCFYEWGPVPAGVPQETKLGPSLFLKGFQCGHMEAHFVRWWYLLERLSIAFTANGKRKQVSPSLVVFCSL